MEYKEILKRCIEFEKNRHFTIMFYRDQFCKGFKFRQNFKELRVQMSLLNGSRGCVSIRVKKVGKLHFNDHDDYTWFPETIHEAFDMIGYQT